MAIRRPGIRFFGHRSYFKYRCWLLHRNRRSHIDKHSIQVTRNTRNHNKCRHASANFTRPSSHSQPKMRALGCFSLTQIHDLQYRVVHSQQLIASTIPKTSQKQLSVYDGTLLLRFANNKLLTSIHKLFARPPDEFVLEASSRSVALSTGSI